MHGLVLSPISEVSSWKKRSEVSWQELISVFKAYGMLQAVSSVYMAHISTRSHSFWWDGTDCKKPLETAQNYAYIKEQISTRKKWSKQTHERTCSHYRHHLFHFWFELFSTFACLDIPPAQLTSHSASWSDQFIMGKMRASLEKIAKEMRNAEFYLKVTDLPNS